MTLQPISTLSLKSWRRSPGSALRPFYARRVGSLDEISRVAVNAVRCGVLDLAAWWAASGISAPQLDFAFMDYLSPPCLLIYVAPVLSLLSTHGTAFSCSMLDVCAPASSPCYSYLFFFCYLRFSRRSNCTAPSQEPRTCHLYEAVINRRAHMTSRATKLKT